MKSLKGKFLVVALVLVATLAMGTSQADAWWGCHYRPAYWCSPCYTACYSPCYYYSCYTPCYYSCYTPCYSCYTPCYSSCYSGCGWGCCSTCGGYDCGCGGAVVSSGAAVYAPHEAEAPRSSEGEAPSLPNVPESPKAAGEPDSDSSLVPLNPSPPASSEPRLPGILDEFQDSLPPEPPPTRAPLPGPRSTSSATSGLLTIYVPYGAKVTINGRETQSAGSKRRYVSYGLQPGYTYKYEVRASIVRDGEVVEDSREVYLRAGAREGVAFGFNEAGNEEIATMW